MHLHHTASTPPPCMYTHQPRGLMHAHTWGLVHVSWCCECKPRRPNGAPHKWGPLGYWSCIHSPTTCIGPHEAIDIGTQVAPDQCLSFSGTPVQSLRSFLQIPVASPSGLCPWLPLWGPVRSSPLGLFLHLRSICCLAWPFGARHFALISLFWDL